MRLKYLLFAWIMLMGALTHSAHAGLVVVTGGTLDMQYDGAVFADRNSTSTPLTALQDYMRYGRYWAPSETVNAGPTFIPKGPAAFRPLPIDIGSVGNPRTPNFRDQRATLDPLYPQTSPSEILGVNTNGTVANSTGNNRISTTLKFDTNNVTGTVTGLAQTNGVSAWWFANDAIMNAGGSWVSWGGLSMRYDASRVGLGYSGWVFANQLGGIGDIFDTKNVSVNLTGSTFTLSGQLFSSSGDSADPYNENFATWETYTLMKPDLQLGSFTFNGNITAVPEPSSMLLLGLAGAGTFGVRLLRKTRRQKTQVN